MTIAKVSQTNDAQFVEYTRLQGQVSDFGVDAYKSYLAAGCSDSTLNEAPWYGRAEPRYLPTGVSSDNVLSKY